MTEKQSYIIGGLAVVLSGLIFISVHKRRYGKKEVKPLPKPSSSTTTKEPMTLKDISVAVQPKQYILKDRQKFFDDWAAEEGGVQSIKDMYAKSPSKFNAADVYYLQSKGILPKDQYETIKPKGLITS